MSWPCFEITHNGNTYRIPYSRVTLTDASIDGDELRYTLTIGQEWETP